MMLGVAMSMAGNLGADTRSAPCQRSDGGFVRAEKLEATTGFEPVNRGFADLRVEPLHHVAWSDHHRGGRMFGWLALEDSNLGSRIQSPLSYH